MIRTKFQLCKIFIYLILYIFLISNIICFYFIYSCKININQDERLIFNNNNNIISNVLDLNPNSFKHNKFDSIFEKNIHEPYWLSKLKSEIPAFDYDDIVKSKEIQIVKFPVIVGASENGQPFNIALKKEEETLAKKLFIQEGFNIYASDRISFERTIPDSRPAKCKMLNYKDSNLPKASVIITFQNEALSMILRTVHTIFKRSPDHLIHEVILIDDFSDRDEIKANISWYINANFPKKVKLLRLKKRSGINGARMVGANVATGEILIFLDSHCEANVNWLQPLLTRIQLNNRTIACPIIDTVLAEDFSFLQTTSCMGGFSWFLHFIWRNIPPHLKDRRQSEDEITKSPTMSGGLFAINRNYFWELGGFDLGMKIWGAENLEMSFKTWMCYGSLEYVPCSRVTHLSRNKHIYSTPSNDFFGINCARLAEVWMDDFKDYFYLFKPEIKNTDIGDISDRISLRKRLKCHNFKWFLENVYPEKFLFSHNVKAWGKVQSVRNCCLDNMGQFVQVNPQNLEINGCSDFGSQIFSYTFNNELRREEMCFTLKNGLDGENILLIACEAEPESDKWEHKRNGAIIHSRSGLCLDNENVNSSDNAIVRKCEDRKPTQMWTFQYYTNM